MKKIIITISVLLILAVAAVVSLYKYIDYQYTKPRASIEEHIFLVNKGDNIYSIANALFKSDKDKFIFSKIARIKRQDTSIKTGEFIIKEDSSIKDILDVLSSNNTVNYTITIVEGYQKYQISQIFNGIENLSGVMPKITLEGVFMPDTYYYKSGDSKQSILQRSYDAMNKFVDNEWDKRDKTIPIKTKEETLILASIIEKETSQEDEYKLVSSVFINRLKKGMKLQADSTAIYGITEGQKKFNRKLFKGDLERENKYNTYYINGLPKGPICNPGKKAIYAALHPADTKYLYFVADGTGGHVFATTGKEHERNVVKWRNIKKGL